MSKKISLLEITPPENLNAPKSGEVFKFAGHTCPNCNGKGGFNYSGWMEKFKDNPVDPDWKICKVCKGTGELEANVVVGWIPCGTIKEQFEDQTT